jgi:hypothetical protein
MGPGFVEGELELDPGTPLVPPLLTMRVCCISARTSSRWSTVVESGQSAAELSHAAVITRTPPLLLLLGPASS